MEQFALIATHPPDQCPTANETIRKFFLNRSPEMTKIAEKLGVEYLAGPIITTEHKSYSIARALEDRLSVKTIEDIFESRRQIRAGKTVPLERLMKEE